MNGSKDARAEAIDWAIRAHSDAFEDWEALTDWLAADPRHAVLYDQATTAAYDAATSDAATSLIDEPARGAPVPLVPVRVPARRRLAAWVPLAMAASVVGAIGVGVTWHHAAAEPHFHTVSTLAGERRSIMLPGTVRMDLNGDSQITLDESNPRFARLDRGQATFNVVHDAKRPFALQVGEGVVTDLGTVFDVEKGTRGTRIAVADGAVRVTNRGSAVVATRGDAVVIAEAGGISVRHGQDIGQIGAWRVGQIDFVDLPLAELAIRLRRATGVPIAVAASVADNRVTGSIFLDRDRDVTLRGLGATLGISVRRSGKGWTWSAGAVANSS